MSLKNLVMALDAVSKPAEPGDDLEYTPITPELFFSTQHYTGLEKNELYEFWVEELSDFIRGGYNELLITGSLGSGKSTAGNLAMMYKYYELFSRKNINKYLNLPEYSDIYNIYFTTSAKQAKLTGFKSFRSMIDMSPWFSRNKPRDMATDSIIQWNNGRFSLTSGSSTSHAIGMNMYSFILDEADFFTKGGTGKVDESYSKVTELYDELVDRRVSRFKKYGTDRSFSILISSATHQSSFMQKRMEAAIDDPTIKVVNAVSYKIKPKGTFSDKTFFVFTGNGVVEPEIIDEKTQLTALENKYKITAHSYDNSPSLEVAVSQLDSRIRAFIESVPIDFEQSFRRNLSKALMNHAGISVSREGKLLQSKDVLTSCYSKRQHPFTKFEFELSSGDDAQIKDYFLPGYLEHIKRPHALHWDASVVNDPTGLSLCRYDGLVYNRDIARRMYTQVFSIRFLAPSAPNQIPFNKVIDFIIYLKTIGVNIVQVSTDNFQSMHARQILKEKNINAVYQSIDKNDAPFVHWVQCMLDKTFDMYYHPVVEKEAVEAVHYRIKRKVDHPKTGTIDILQSLVGALYGLISVESSIESENSYYLGESLVSSEQLYSNVKDPFIIGMRTQSKNKFLKDLIG